MAHNYLVTAQHATAVDACDTVTSDEVHKIVEVHLILILG